MKQLTVVYAGWDERFPLANLADDGKKLLFQYTGEALERGLELSPYQLPLQAAASGNFPTHQQRLPGLVSDSLPDGWGMLLMDRLFRKAGRDIASISPLDRLAFIGDRGMGALIFEPPNREQLPAHDVELLRLAEHVQDIVTGQGEDMLQDLAMMGGSPHGARPKVRINFDVETGQATNNEQGPGTPWLIKFPGQNEHPEVCAIEYVYADAARRAGIYVPPTRFFQLNRKLTAFGIERFDRFLGKRVQTHTVSGLAHADFRIPAISYSDVLRLTRLLTGDEREVLALYRRCVFNVVFHNRDDHSKNLSYLLNRDDHWQVSPGYDLTFQEGPGGYHQMDVCGEAVRITRADLEKLAKENNIKPADAADVLEEVCEATDHFADALFNHSIRRATANHIWEKVSRARDLAHSKPGR